jgi:hypothetical protein
MTIGASEHSVAYWLGLLEGRGQSFQVAGFQVKDLPTTFTRRGMSGCRRGARKQPGYDEPTALLRDKAASSGAFASGRRD